MQIAADQLRQYIERIERLEEEKSGLAADLRDVFAEAKGNGFDVPTMKKIIRMRAQSREEVMEAEMLLDTYRAALGMIPEVE